MSSSIDTETGASPWDSDLAATFEDEATRAAVSEFLGEKVQPYVTKLEQESKPERDASLLWEQFHEQPVDTTIQVIRELYGEDKAEAFADILQGKENEITPEDVTVEGEANEPAPTDTSVKFDQLPPEVQKIVQDQKEEESRKAYYGEIDRLVEAHKDELPKDEQGNPKLDVDLLHPFVVSAEGNFDAAYEGFQNWIKLARGESAPTDPADPPPPALNSQTRDSSSSVPTKNEHQTLDGALDEMFDELKNPPPTVGDV